eukprot:5347175-Pyramimonas_sp.AAC.1
MGRRWVGPLLVANSWNSLVLRDSWLGVSVCLSMPPELGRWTMIGCWRKHPTRFSTSRTATRPSSGTR